MVTTASSSRLGCRLDASSLLVAASSMSAKIELGMQANSEDLVLLPLPLRFRAPAAQLHTLAAYNKIGTHEFCERMTKREASLHSRRRQRRLAARSG